MKIEYEAITNIGARKENQDFYLVHEEIGNYLFVVADGLGAHRDSALAARYICESLKEILSNFIQNLNTQKNETIPENMLKSLFENYFNAAVDLMEKKLIAEKAYDAKTTVVVVYLNDTNTFCAHVGDSRIYHLTKKGVVWRTTDHSLSQSLVDRGEILPSEQSHHSSRNVLLKCLGTSRNPDPSITMRPPLKQGEAILLATDGFWEGLDEEDFSTFLKSTSLKETLEAYVNRIVSTVPHADNLTAVFGKCKET